MAKPIWFPFYPNDFLASGTVKLMTTEEIGAYILLLCYEWQDPKCTLPSDDESIRNLSGLAGNLERVKSCFNMKRGRLINKRLQSEWKKAKAFKEICSKSGKNGANRRWPQRVTPPVTPPVTGAEHSSPSQSPSQSQSELEKKEEKKPVRATVTDEQWIEGLKNNPAYRHINLSVELGKMEAWLDLPKNQHRKKTKAFVLNWLNKIEAPMVNGSTGQRPPPPPPKNDPIGRGQWGRTYGRPEDHGYQ